MKQFARKPAMNLQTTISELQRRENEEELHGSKRNALEYAYRRHLLTLLSQNERSAKPKAKFDYHQYWGKCVQKGMTLQEAHRAAKKAQEKAKRNADL